MGWQCAAHAYRRLRGREKSAIKKREKTHEHAETVKVRLGNRPSSISVYADQFCGQGCDRTGGGADHEGPGIDAEPVWPRRFKLLLSVCGVRSRHGLRR